jgi:ribosomal protein L11 methyltransferase
VIEPHDEGFGTGSHPTTRACLELLLDVPAGGSLADLGCGSGVLAIAAVKLGFGPVLAVDREAAAVEATARNARVNRTSMEVAAADLLVMEPPAAVTVTANVPPAIHDHLAAQPAEVVHVIASGVGAAEAEAAAAAYARAGLTEIRRIQDGGWVALLLGRRS